MQSRHHIFTLLLVLSLLPLSLQLAQAAQAASGPISGTIFLDYKGDGRYDANDSGVAHVRVRAYDAAGKLQGTAQSASDGAYSFTPNGNGPYRIEFSAWPSHLQPSALGPDNGGSVQFLNDTPSTAHFGLVDPSKYSQADPLVSVSYFHPGSGKASFTANTTTAGIRVFSYQQSGKNGDTGYTAPIMSVPVSEIGSVWGSSYQRDTKQLFVSSALRRHAGFAHGPSYLYLLDYGNGPSNTPLVKLSLEGALPSNGGPAIELGSVCRNDSSGGPSNPSCVEASQGGTGISQDYSLPDDPSQTSIDLDAFGKVGTVSFGGNAISPDQNSLWLVNLYQQALIKLDVSNIDPSSDSSFASSIGSVEQYLLDDLSGLPSCTKGEFRPWALTFHNGYGYLGGVCSGETEDTLLNDAPSDYSATTRQRRTNANTSAHVLRFDPSNLSAGFSQQVQFPLSYRREPHSSALNSAFNVSTWQPWALGWNDYVNLTMGSGVYQSYSQAIVSDIVFDDDGAMLIGMADRLALQLGMRQPQPVSQSSSLIYGASAGDLIKVCSVAGAWIIEGSDPSCPVNEPSNPDLRNDDGPSNQGEFFYNDTFGDHRETAQGGLAYLAGSGEVMSSSMDPLQYHSGGVRRYNSSNGTVAGNYEVYLGAWDDRRTFHKANGLGDLEILSDPAPIEIGNRVWFDSNFNGLQDAGENGIAGVSVRLYAPDGALLGSALTDNNGNYSFSSGAGSSSASAQYGISGLRPNTTGYQIRIDNPADYGTGGALEYAVLTLPNIQSGDSDLLGDISDSDASLLDPSLPIGPGNFPLKQFDLASSGANNHSYDFGFYSDFDLALRIRLATDQTYAVGLGDQVTFAITIFNQGTIPAHNIEIISYLPKGLTLADSNWSLQPNGYATQLIAGPIAPGESKQIELQTLVERSNSPGRLTNAAEIVRAEDSSGNQANDIDSTPDSDPDNDGKVIDDQIYLRAPRDEDDHDIALLEISTSSTVEIGEVTSTQQKDGVLVGWSTTNEQNIVGFHVLRGSSPSFAQAEHITNALIPANGNTSSGFAYQWLDRSASNDMSYYWIASHDQFGNVQYAGPFSNRLSGPQTATPTTTTPVVPTATPKPTTSTTTTATPTTAPTNPPIQSDYKLFLPIVQN
jgi:uncharacterized repeat protein (TIGR01451 family)